LPLQHCLVTALCLGLALANALRLDVSAAAIGALVLVAGMALYGRSRLRLFLIALLFALLGLAIGSLRLSSLDRSPLTAHIGESAPARVVVTGPPRVSSYAVSAVGQIEHFGRKPLHERIWLRLPPGKKPPIGAVLELSVKLELPQGPSSSGFDQRAWLARQGIHVVLRGGPWHLVSRRGGLGGFGDRLRERLARDLVPGLKGERRGLVLGFVLGEDDGLSDGLRQSFRRSGLYHLLAVSGQNIAFLVAGVLGIAWLCGIPRGLGEVLALTTIVAYVLVVGWQPSVVRAAVAGGLASLAWLAARPRDRWYFLLLGALTLLVWNPRSVFDAGFQLSFAAVIAIFVLVKPLEQRHDFVAGGGVQVAGGFVGQQDGRVIDQRASDRDALPLAAGELVGFMEHAVAEADVFEGVAGTFEARRLAQTGVNERKLDVVQRIGAWQQIERLENETNLAVADLGELVVDHVRDVLAVELVAAGRRRIEAAEHVHQGGLAAAGRSHDGDILVAMDLEGDPAQRVDDL